MIVAVGVSADGRREALGVDIGPSEAEPFWVEFLRWLARRGLRGVKLARQQWRRVADLLRPKVPAELMDEAAPDRLACMTFPQQHRIAPSAPSSSSRTTSGPSRAPAP